MNVALSHEEADSGGGKSGHESEINDDDDIYIYDADDDSDEDEDDEVDLTTSLIGQILQVLVTSLMLKQTSFTRSLMKIK